MTIIKDKLIEKASGSTFLEISKKDIASITIELPSLPEQKAIAQILSDMDSEIEALEKKLHKYKLIKEGMMEKLLTGKVRLV
jgi:type I restriction enzyme S subunit